MAWRAPVLEGEIVRLEPIAAAHEKGLWAASRDPRTWRWLSIEQPRTRAELRAYLDAALTAAAEGSELPLVTVRRSDGRVVGSSRCDCFALTFRKTPVVARLGIAARPWATDGGKTSAPGQDGGGRGGAVQIHGHESVHAGSHAARQALPGL